MILVDLDPTREMLIKQLIQEGLNASTHYVVAVAQNEDLHKQVLATRDLDHSKGPIVTLTTPLDLLIVDRQCTNDTPKGSQVGRSCWECGELGHLQCDCPWAKPRTRFPRLNRRVSWTKDCRSQPVKHQSLQTSGMVLLSPTSKSRPW